jgi:type II secretory pathway pseudopilin PulG
MISESVLIIVSILLALSADAWLDSRKQAAQLDGQLAALARDFDTMLEKVNASHSAANRGAETGRNLSLLLKDGSEIDPDLARDWLWHLVFYEVFSPSTGAYQALIASGNLELLENDELKLELSDFFGSFEDVRASERLQLDTQIAVFGSETFSELAGWHRMGVLGLPVAGQFPVEQWSGSDEFMNAVGILTVRQIDVLEDYEYLRTRIQSIAAAIALEASN